MAKIRARRRKPTLALRQRKAALLRQLAPPPPDALRASSVERFATCGKPNCRCAQGHKHGPCCFLTQCLAVGHVQKFLRKDPAQQAAAQPGLAAYHRFHDTLAELSQVNAELLRRGEPLAAPAA